MTGGRWVDGDAPDEVREVLRAARKPAPLDRATFERSRRRVAALPALPAAAGAFFWLQHAAWGAAAGVLVTAAVVAPRVMDAGEPPARLAPAPSGPAGSKGISPRTGTRPRGLPVAVPSAEPPRPAAVVPPSAPSRSVPDAGANDVAAEARLLERAHAALDRDPALALRLLRDHATLFPRGTLELEREFLAVDALVRLDRRSEAEARAAALRSRAPGSLYERRLRHLLEAERR